jgi:hypothetical protein
MDLSSLTARSVSGLRDLIVESGEVDSLLGRRLPHGGFAPGVLADLLPDTELNRVTRDAAVEFEKHGQQDTAVRLYDLARVRRCVVVSS